MPDKLKTDSQVQTDCLQFDNCPMTLPSHTQNFILNFKEHEYPLRYSVIRAEDFGPAEHYLEGGGELEVCYPPFANPSTLIIGMLKVAPGRFFTLVGRIYWFWGRFCLWIPCDYNETRCQTIVAFGRTLPGTGEIEILAGSVTISIPENGPNPGYDVTATWNSDGTTSTNGVQNGDKTGFGPSTVVLGEGCISCGYFSGWGWGFELEACETPYFPPSPPDPWPT